VIPSGKTNVKGEIRRRRPQHADEELLRAASAVFAREGYAAASVSRIAEAAGATKPTLYARFGSKEELFEATMRYHAEAILEQLFAAYDLATTLKAPDAIRAGVEAWFAFAKERPDGMTLLFGEHIGAHSRVAEQTTEAIIARIARVVDHYTERRGHPAREAAPVIAAMIVGTSVHAIRRCLADPSLNADAVSALTTSFIVAATARIDPNLFALAG